MDFSDPSTYILIVTTVITALSFIVKGLAILTGITPGDKDDAFVSNAQKLIAKVQGILGTFALDASPNKGKKG